MIEAVLILTFSLALFVYWFRYTVILLLSEDRTPENSGVLSHLTVLETRRTLRRAEGELDALHRALEKDYRVLRYLLDHAAGLGLRPLEHFLLLLDYRLLRIWYWLTRSTSTRQARLALQEMAGVLSYIACKMGERTSTPSQA